MGFWRSLVTGQPSSTTEAFEAVADLTQHRFTTGLDAVDAASIPPEVFGIPAYASPLAPSGRVSRREAIQVAAVKRARDLICGPLGTLPLVTVRPDFTQDTTSWLNQPESDVPRSVTMTRTVEDLLFEGIAWWKVTAFDWRGFPARAVRLDPRSVDVQSDGRVHVTGDGHRGMADEWPTDRDLIRFDSPNDALLVAGARAIRQCLALDTAALRYADGNQPLDYFTPADGADPAEDEDVVAILDDWAAARKARVTGYVPAALKYNTAGWNPDQLQLAEQRQHAVLEIARVAGVDPEELGVSTTSRTYSNQWDRRKAFLDFTLGGYRAAVEDRLSMGDVTPRGHQVRYGMDEFLRTSAKERWEAAEIGLRVGAITRPEIRADEKRPALPPQAQERTDPVSQPQRVESTSTIVREVQAFDASTGPDTVTFEAPAAPETFAVDRDKRTITGLAMPYGVKSNDGRNFVFTRGSFAPITDPSRIKHLIGHDWTQAVGRGLTFEDTDAGLVVTLKVARGPEGDRALSMAEDGVWDGLSCGVGKGMKTVLRDGLQFVTEGGAQLREISQTPCPAYPGARITEVAASAQREDTPMKCQKCNQVHGAGVTACDPTALETFQAEQEAQAFSHLVPGLTEAIGQAFAGALDSLQNPQEGPEPVSAGGRVEVTHEPAPYRFDGTEGSHGFVDDMRAAQHGDPDARQRLAEFGETFAVTTGNVGTLNPTQHRPDLYVPNMQFTRPLWEMVSTGVVTDKTPFTVPKFASASGLVANHTEGVEPTPGAFTATSQTITPGPVSGKIEINREVLDQGGNPKADAIIWGEMLNAYFEAIESRIAAALAATTTPELNLAGATDAALVNALTNYFAGLQFVRGGNRFTAFAADGKLFPAAINAADSTGRKLLPVMGPTNAQGTTSGNFDRVAVGSQQIRAAWALGVGANTRSYSFVPSSVWAWASAPKKFLFEYQVKSVDLAIWGYGATAILRDSDVKPIDYDTSDV